MKRRKIKTRYPKSRNAFILVALVIVAIVIPTFFIALKDIITTKVASNNSLGRWISLGMEGVNVGAIAISPDFSSDHTLFINSSDGVFKSINAGHTWEKLSGLSWGDPLSYNPYSSAIAVSPEYPIDKTVFANTSDSTGLYRSQDSGNTWELMNIGQDQIALTKVAFSPNYKNDYTIFAGGNDLIAISNNRGSSWQILSLPNWTITEFAFSPNYFVDQTLFVTVSINPGENQPQINGLYKSTDGGVTWNLMVIPYQQSDPASIALSPNFVQDHTIFVGTGAVDGLHHLIKSVDSGMTWQPSSVGIPQTDVQEIVITQNNTLYAGTGGDGAFISNDFGNSWQLLNDFPVNNSCNGFASFAISPQYVMDGTLFAGCTILNTGNEAGVWKHVLSRGPDRDFDLLSPFNNGVTWTVSQGYFNNSDQSKIGCHVGLGPDHCRNQLFGLDMVSDQQSDSDILAPGNGKVAFKGKLEDEDCIGLRITLDNGLNLNVCHFASFNVSLGERIVRGKVLGIRSTPHVHLSLDDRYRIGTLCPGQERCFLPIPFDEQHTLEGIVFNPDPNGETVLLPYSLCDTRKVDCQFEVGFQQYKGTPGISTNVAIP